MTPPLTPGEAMARDFAQFEREFRAGRPAPVPYRTDDQYEALPFARFESSWRPA